MLFELYSGSLFLAPDIFNVTEGKIFCWKYEEKIFKKNKISQINVFTLETFIQGTRMKPHYKNWIFALIIAQKSFVSHLHRQIEIKKDSFGIGNSKHSVISISIWYSKIFRSTLFLNLCCSSRFCIWNHLCLGYLSWHSRTNLQNISHFTERTSQTSSSFAELKVEMLTFLKPCIAQDPYRTIQDPRGHHPDTPSSKMIKGSPTFLYFIYITISWFCTYVLKNGV